MRQLSNPLFEQVYKQLNSAQKTAVDTIDGPVMVIAGPGTGKTQVLSVRIANILRLTDTNPTSILALTFTESAASNMRKRLVSIIGQTGYYVKITTFHSFCVEVIQTHPDYFNIVRGSEPLSELERYQIFQELLQKVRLDVLRPINSPLYYLREIIQSISQLKREGVTLVSYKKIIESVAYKKDADKRTQQKNKELLKVYQAYQDKLQQTNRYDFEDMIQFVVEAFSKHKSLLQDYQEKLLYFLVDEYQDTNNSQNQLLKQLTNYWGQGANVFIVGDPHQSIFRFQGASTENMISFIEWFPKSTIIRLHTGYRAPQVFYDAASAVINNNQLTHTGLKTKTGRVLSEFMNTPVQAKHKEEGKIIVEELPSQLVEYVYIAKSIESLLKKGITGDRIAVLYRHNHDAQVLRETFDKWGILYELDAGDDVLKNEFTRQLITLFNLILAIRNGQEDTYMFEVLCYPWINQNIATVVRLAQVAGRAKISLSALLQKGYAYYAKIAGDEAVTPIEFVPFTQFMEKVSTWSAKDFSMVFPQWFEEIINESGYVNWAMHQSDRVVLLTNLSTLFSEVKSLCVANHNFKLVNFVKVIDTLSHFHIELHAEDLNIVEGAVKLSTVHKAKGQEWDYVFLIHCIDGKWGNSISRDLIPLPKTILKNTDITKKENNEDERRLFYVALTRAKKQISLSYPATLISQTHSKTTIPSMFIDEIPKSLLIKRNDFTASSDSLAFLEKILTPQKTFFYNTIEASYFHKLINSFTFSATALNTYLKDTDEFVRTMLLRIPRAKSTSMAFGSAIHKSLEFFYKHLQKKEALLSYDALIKIFQQSLQQELLTTEDYKRRLHYGKKILRGYYDAYLQDAKKPFLVERFFGGTYRPVMFDDIPLSGRIDRIDWVDQSRGYVRVIDYKTGSPKTMGQLQGTTKSTPLSKRELELPESLRGAYKRQLLFYKLITELDTTFDQTVVEGEFDFIEPDKSKGMYIRRSFPLEQSEIGELKLLIRQVMKEIRNLEFLEEK